MIKHSIRIEELNKLIDYLREEYGNDSRDQKEIDLLILQKKFLEGDQPWAEFKSEHPEITYFLK